MIKFPSIEQYRNVVRNVQQKARYKGVDEVGKAIFDPFIKLPKLKFEGTVKLHGTNAAVGFARDDTMWVQSRENIITPEKDNAGFAAFAQANIANFKNIAQDAFALPNIIEGHVLIFGEWCGGNIQKGVAISQIPKMFVIFGIALVDNDNNKKYLTRTQVEKCTVGFNASHSGQIFSIYNYPTFGCEIDFENPHEIQQFLTDRTTEVGDECPVGRAFGVFGVGEGIVWRCVTEGWEDSQFWFKVKDERHSNSKVKTLPTVDVERINDIKELCDKLANDGRLAQGLQVVFNTLNDGEVDIKRTGDFIKWIMSDIFKEETDTIAASGFNGKELNGPIGKMARDYLMQNLRV